MQCGHRRICSHPRGERAGVSPVEVIKHRRAQLVQPGERELHLRLHPGGAHHPAPRRGPEQVSTSSDCCGSTPAQWSSACVWRGGRA